MEEKGITVITIPSAENMRNMMEEIKRRKCEAEKKEQQQKLLEISTTVAKLMMKIDTFWEQSQEKISFKDWLVNKLKSLN